MSHTPEGRARIAAFQRGRVRSPETRRRIAEAKKGTGAMDKHPNWQGGTTRDADGYVLIKRPDHPNANGCEHVERWGVTPVTREQQTALMRLDAPLARNRVTAMMEAHWAEIYSLVVARVDAGYDLYGTRGFQKTPYELDQDTLEELADAIAYQVMARHRRNAV